MSSSKIYKLPARHRSKLIGLGFLFLVLGLANVTLNVLMQTRPERPQVSSDSRPAPKAVIPALVPAIANILMGLLFTASGLDKMRRGLFHGSAEVMVDDEGLRPTDPPRDNLLRWQDVAATRELPYRQQLDLLDREGNSRLRLDYELEDLSELRELLGGRLPAPPELRSLPFVLLASPWRFLGLGVFLAFFLVIGAYLLAQGSMLVAFFGLLMFALAGVLMFQMATSPTSLTVKSDLLELSYPFRSKILRREDILGVRTETSRKGLFQTVRTVLCPREGSDRKLHFESMPPTELRRLLEDWLELPVRQVGP